MENGQALCFADFEFTCGFYIDKAQSELLSVGLVICDSSYNIIETYYRTARPNIYRRLTKQCRKLTKLTQEEIDASADSEEVMTEVTELLKKHRIKKIGVWGNFDRPGLLSDIKQHHRAGKKASAVSRVLSCVCDIQAETIRKMQLPQAINIKDLASAFDFVPENGAFHNALTDALALHTVVRAVWTSDIYANAKFKALKQERLDKINADKVAAEQRRREITMLIPFTAAEQEYFPSLATEAARNDYLKLRFRIMNIFQRCPDEKDFYFIVLHSPRRTKLAPAARFSAEKYSGADITAFSHEDFDRILVSESKRRELVRA